MIDFHTHILPNIDDGSKSIEETFNLIKEAEKAGFKKIISTSHYLEKYYEVDVIERKAWIDTLNKTIKEGNEKIKLYLGNEIYFSDNIIRLLEEGKATTITYACIVLAFSGMLIYTNILHNDNGVLPYKTIFERDKK